MTDPVFKPGDKVRVINEGSGSGPVGTVTTVKEAAGDFVAVTGDELPAYLHGRYAWRYELVPAKEPKVIDPYKYDGLTIKCHDDPNDTLTVELDCGSIVIENLIDNGDCAAILLTPKKARKLAKALRALADTAEASNG